MARTIDLNITIDQGATFEQLVQVLDQDRDPVNLTGFSGVGEVRDTYGGSLLATFTVSVTTPATGYVKFSLTPTSTGALSFTTPAVYDVDVVSGTVRYRVARGTATLALKVNQL